MDVQALINVAVELVKKEGVQVTVKQSFRGGAIAGSCAFLGGLVGGPVGIAAGGIIGSLIGGATSGKFKPLYLVIRDDLTEAEQMNLAKRIYDAVKNCNIKNVKIDDAAHLSLVLNNLDMKNVMMEAVLSYANEELGLAIAKA